MFVVIILFTLRILSVNCDLNFIDPTIPPVSNVDFDITSKMPRMLSSASPYNTEMSPEEITSESTDCTPTKAWFLIRHGTKYPSEDVLDGIRNKLVRDIQDTIKSVYADECQKNFILLKNNQQQIIQRIKNWKNQTDSGTHKDLNEDGILMMQRLGERWNNKLNKLTNDLKLNEIEVLSAVEDRCVVSGQQFLSKFYKKDYDKVKISTAVDDMRLKLVKPAKKNVKVKDPSDSNNSILVEDLYFKNNSATIIEKIQQLLFPDHIDKYQEYRAKVTGEIVQIMYDACTHTFYYEDENGTKSDAWCYVFTFEDFKMFEEMDDLKYYNQNGYHIDFNTTMGNPITNDLLQFIKEPNGLKFKLFIGHTSNVLSVITRLNLFRDNQKLTVDNIKDMPSRKWRSSYMVPLGCNIVVVVYNCGVGPLKVSVYLNEIPIKMVLDGGETCIKCSLDDFIQKLVGFKLDENLNVSKSTKDSYLEDIKTKEERKKKKKECRSKIEDAEVHK